MKNMTKNILLLITFFSMAVFGARGLDIDEIKSSDRIRLWTMPVSAGTLDTTTGTTTLTNKSISGSSNTLTNIPYTALSSMTSSQLSGVVSDETGSGSLVFGTNPTLTNATITNGTLTGPIISTGSISSTKISTGTIVDALTLTQIATPSSPPSGSNKLYTKSDKKLYILDSAGNEKSAGGVSPWSAAGSYQSGDMVSNLNKTWIAKNNFTSNSTFAADISSGTMWNEMSIPINQENYLLAGTNFEDGLISGFSAVSCATITNSFPACNGSGAAAFSSSNGGASAHANLIAPAVTSSNPLNGAYSLNFATSGTVPAGNMYISQPFRPPLKAAGRTQEIAFDYKVVSGTFDLTGGTGGDLGIGLYDMSNNSWIQPVTAFNFIQGSGVGRYTGTVQLPTTGTYYQVGLFYPTAGTYGANSLYADDFFVGPQRGSQGSPITDWVSYTPTLSNGSGGITNATTSGKWRRVGDEIEITGDITFSAASAAFSVLYVSIPSGLSVDTNKINVTNFPNLGLVNFYDNGVINYSGRARYKDTTTFHINYGYVNTSDAGVATDPAPLAAISNTTPFTYGASDGISFTYKVPISGWSSGTQMSADAGNSGVVAFESRLSGTQTISATTETTVQFNSTLIDTAGAANTGAYSFVAPSSGYYDIAASVNTGGDIAEVHYLRIKVDGAARRTSTKTLTANDLIHSIFASNVYLTSGQVVTITSQSTSDASYTLGAFASTAFTVKKLQGNQVIAASDTVAARYMTDAGQSIANGATAIVDFEDISHDYQGSVTTGASWKFTAPVSGLYSVDAVVRYANNQAWTQAGYIYIAIYKNGAVYSERGEIIDSTYTPASNGPQIEMYDTIRLLAGEYIDIRTSHGESTARTLLVFQRYNRININRIGNY